MTAVAAAPTRAENLARSVAVSTSTQLVARGADLCVNVIVALVIIRHLGPEGYGDFVVVITVAGLTGLLADLGLPKLAVRELVREPTIADAVVGSVTAVRVGLTAVSLVVAQLALFPLHATAEVRVATGVAGSMALAEALLSVVIVFHAAVRQHHEAAIRLVANVAKLALVLLLVQAGAGLVALVAATTATLLIASALGWVQARRRFGVRASWDWPLVRSLLREAVAVGPALLIGVLYLKVGAVLVALLGTRTEVGVFGAAYQPIEYAFLGTAVIVQVLYTVLARSAPGTERFAGVYQRGTEALLLIVVPAALVLAAGAAALTRLAYDDAFDASSVPLALLAVALVGMTVNVWQGMVLLAANRAGANLRCLVTALAVNVTLGLALVPAGGPAGAAWATLLSTLVLVVSSTRAVSRLAGADLALRRLAGLAVGAGALLAAMGVTSWVGGHPALGALLGLVLYGVVVLRAGLVPVAALRAARRGGASTSAAYPPAAPLPSAP